MDEKVPKKQNLLSRIVALFLTVCLILGGVVLVVYRDRLNLDALRRLLEYRHLQTSQTGEAVPFSHAGGKQMSIAYLKSGVLTASSTGVRYYSVSGDLYVEEVMNMEHPVLHSVGDIGVAYDAGGKTLFVFRDRAEVFQLELEGSGDLLSARVNENGWLVVTAQESGYKGAVTVYDSSYTRKMIQINLSSTFIVDAAISPDNKTVAVVTMNQEAGAFQSQVWFYPIDAKEPSAIVNLGNKVALDLDYEDDTLWVLGESSVTIIGKNGETSNTYSLGRDYLKGASLDGDGFALLLLGRYRSGSANRAVTIGADGTELGSMAITSSALAQSAAGRYIGLLSGDELSIYTWDFTPYSSITQTGNARYLSLSDDGSTMLANAQHIWLYLPQ